MVKIIFFGTPEIAVPFLKECLEKHSVIGVITQPDKPSSRHYKIHLPEVKTEAAKNKVAVFQPEKFDDELIEKIKNLKPDIGVVVSYGKLIPKKVFDLPAFGCFNIHFSLLPKYRGAAPVQWALINGEKLTGVTSFWIEETLDSGPILVQKTVQIGSDDDAASLFKKLIPVGIEVMNETLDLLKNGKVPGTPQKGIPSLAPSLEKEDGKINWTKSAEEILNLIKGTYTWPGAYTLGSDGKMANKRLKIIKARLIPSQIKEKSGAVVELKKNEGFVVGCGEGAILITEVQPENKNPMSAWEFIQGGYVGLGSKFV
jgi:methionyl-tRNA formyltransferase